MLCLKLLDLALVVDFHERLAVSALDDFETPVLDVLLDEWVVKFLTNETLGVVDGVERVFGNLVLSCISYQSFVISECYLTRCCLVTLIIGNDLHVVVAENWNTRLGGS